MPAADESSPGALDPRLLRLHQDDNVLTVISALDVGDQLQFGESRIGMTKPLALGHKVAARAIAAGEKIIKYGVPIGSATRAISPGEHVHTHNLQSDYLPTYLREDQARLFAVQQHP
jgi:altronate dehydratase small subunit